MHLWSEIMQKWKVSTGTRYGVPIRKVVKGVEEGEYLYSHI